MGKLVIVGIVVGLLLGMIESAIFIGEEQALGSALFKELTFASMLLGGIIAFSKSKLLTRKSFIIGGLVLGALIGIGLFVSSGVWDDIVLCVINGGVIAIVLSKFGKKAVDAIS